MRASGAHRTVTSGSRGDGADGATSVVISIWRVGVAGVELGEHAAKLSAVGVRAARRLANSAEAEDVSVDRHVVRRLPRIPAKQSVLQQYVAPGIADADGTIGF
jgi:hypothetical protein